VAFFAHLFGAELRILRVFPPAASRRAQNGESLSRLPNLAAIGAELGIAVRVEDRSGPARPTIVDYARSHRAVLLAVDALLGAHSLQRMGTVVARLGRSAPCPVLVLPRPKRRQAPAGGELREVLCALDHGPAAAATLDAALSIARQARSRLTLLHVLHGLSVPVMLSGMEAARVVRQCEALADSERRRLRRLVPASAGKELRIQYVIESGEPRRAIARTAADAGAELIVMGVVPRNLVDIVLVGSTSGPVVRRASVPVMLVPPLPSSPATKSRSSRHVETLRHRRR
jgi:nucleotide-binding universal stress UspA family protein